MGSEPVRLEAAGDHVRVEALGTMSKVFGEFLGTMKSFGNGGFWSHVKFEATVTMLEWRP